MTTRNLAARRERMRALRAHESTGSFGFAEELDPMEALRKLHGANYIDDGALFEADGPTAAESIRGLLASMDGHAAAIRGELNALVRDGLGVVEGIQSVNLGEGTEDLGKLKPTLNRLLTAYTELVAGLQGARDSIGYEVEGPSVTTTGEEPVSERITRQFAQRQTRGLAENRRVRRRGL